MASGSLSWGIEVGAGGIKAIALEAGSGDQVSVVDYAVIPHKKSLSEPGTNPDDVLRITLGQFMGQVDLTGASVAMSVPGHSAFARFAKLPPVEPKKVPDIVKFEAVQQIPFPIEEVEWDYQTFVSPDSPDIEVGIFAIKRDWMKDRLALYADVNLVPDIVTLSPVAAYNAMAYDLQFTEKTPGTIVLDIGTTSTDLVVAEAGRVWVRTFPIGGHHFTEALVNAFKLTYPKAEKLKREAEDSKHARHVFQAMRPVFSDLAQDVQRSIGYYQSLHKDANLTRLIGVGSTFLLPGIRKYLKQQIALEVYRVEQFKRLSLQGQRSADFQNESIGLMTAYGLALQGLGLSALNANLMPSNVIRESMWHKKIKWFGVAAGIAAATGGAMFIRPFLDAQAVAAAPRDPVIDSVIADVNALKARATEAGVTGQGERDLTPANLVALLNDREIYPYMMKDLREIFAFAQARAGAGSEGPVLVLSDYRTDYIAPEAPAEDPSAADPLSIEQPRGRGGIEGGPDPFSSPIEPGARPAGISKHTDKPRILVSLEVSTTQPDAPRFMIATVEEWLRVNAVRAGVPYQIFTTGEPWESIGFEVGGKPGERAIAGAEPTEDPRLSSTRGGRGRGGIQDEPIVDNSQYILEGQDVQHTGGDTPTSFEGASKRRTSVELDKTAPLPDEPPLAEGVRRERFVVTWEVVLKMDEKKEDGE